LAGFGTGLAGPWRDMLIKRAAPPGATVRARAAPLAALGVVDVVRVVVAAAVVRLEVLAGAIALPATSLTPVVTVAV